jgi:hypothetical protein
MSVPGIGPIISSAIVAAIGEHTQFISELSDRLESSGHQVKYALRDSDPKLAEKPTAERARLCYLWDRQMVEDSDLLLAEASFPSTGLGIEMQIAESKGIPTVLCFRDFRILPGASTKARRRVLAVQAGQINRSWRGASGRVPRVGLRFPSCTCFGFSDGPAGLSVQPGIAWTTAHATSACHCDTQRAASLRKSDTPPRVTCHSRMNGS